MLHAVVTLRAIVRYLWRCCKARTLLYCYRRASLYGGHPRCYKLRRGFDVAKLVQVAQEVLLGLHGPRDEGEVHAHPHDTGGAQVGPALGHCTKLRSELAVSAEQRLQKYARELRVRT
jgi:hypothetical protein